MKEARSLVCILCCALFFLACVSGPTAGETASRQLRIVQFTVPGCG